MRRLTTLTRRHILEGMGAGALSTLAGAAPFLTKVPSAFAQAKAPTRFLLVTFPFGSWGFKEFWDLGLASGAPLPARLASKTFLAGHPTDRWLLQPLEPYRDYLTLVGGLKVTYSAAKVGAHGCTQVFLTGSDVYQWGPGEHDFNALGPSVEQYIAQRIGEKEPINASRRDGMYFTSTQVLGGRMVNQRAPQINAAAIANRFFNIGPVSQAQSADLPAFRRVLGRVYGDINRERLVLPQEDRQLMDQYLTELRDLEARHSQPRAPVSCNVTLPPAAPASTVKYRTQAEADREAAKAGYEDVKLRSALVVQAFACNLTRVASLCPGANWGYQFLPAEAKPPDTYRWQDDPNRCEVKPWAVEEHGMDHHPNGECGGYPPHWVGYRLDIDLFYMRWFAEHVLKPLTRQDPLDVPGRTLLDNTLIMMTRDHATREHRMHPLLHIFAGGAGGALERGRYVYINGDAQTDNQDSGNWNNRALITACHLMGLKDVTQFGNARRSAGGPLPILRT